MAGDRRIERDGRAAPGASQIHVKVGAPGADIPGLDNRAVQAALDYAAGLGGGTVELTEGEFQISDALYLRRNVVLRGQGDRTVLRKCDAIRSNLRFDADMHESSVTLVDADGFEVGMGVSIGDETHAVQHLVSVRTVIWKSGATLRFSKNLETTQMVGRGAFAQITFPVVYGVDVENVAVENLAVDGNSAGNPLIDSWTDGGIYLLRVKGGRVANCRVYDVNADGISLNQSDDIVMEGCFVHENARLGIHIGTGSQNAVVMNCRIFENGFAGLSNSDGLNLCFSAQHGLYQGNEISGNRGAGISIGHKDGENLFADNVVRGNGHGVFYRSDTYRTYRNRFENCVIEDNGGPEEGYGFYICGDAHDTQLEGCRIRDMRPQGQKRQRIGVYIGPGLEGVRFENCHIEGHSESDVVDLSGGDNHELP